MAAESDSPWPKNGLAGKVQSARTHAPDDVPSDDLRVLTVGYTAWSEERDVTDVWREVRHDDLGQWGESR